MKKKILLITLLSISALGLLTGCGRKNKTVHCDACGAEITIPESNPADEDWILFCTTCAEEKEPAIED